MITMTLSSRIVNQLSAINEGKIRDPSDTSDTTSRVHKSHKQASLSCHRACWLFYFLFITMVSMCYIPTITIVTILVLGLLQQHQPAYAFCVTTVNVNNLQSSSLSLTLPSSLCIRKKHGRSSSYQLQQQQQQEGRVLSQGSQRQTRRHGLSISEVYDIICIFVPKIILELFGSVGACWGFSEVIGLRTANTTWFWKPFSLAIGGLYTIRFCIQLQNHYKLFLSKRSTMQSPPVSNNSTITTRTDTDVRF